MNGIGSRIQLQNFNTPLRLDFNQSESNIGLGTSSGSVNHCVAANVSGADPSIVNQGQSIAINRDPLTSRDLNTAARGSHRSFSFSVLGKALLAMILQCLHNLEKQFSLGSSTSSGQCQSRGQSPTQAPSSSKFGLHRPACEGTGQGTFIDGAAAGAQGHNQTQRTGEHSDNGQQTTVLPTSNSGHGVSNQQDTANDVKGIKGGKSETGTNSRSPVSSAEVPAFSSTSNSPSIHSADKASAQGTVSGLQPFSPVAGRATDPVTFSDKPTVVNKTIYVAAGQVFDGKNATFTAGKELGDGSQSETQKPLFRLGPGATLKNVKIGDDGADGIHCYGDANIDNVHWKNVGEDALTSKGQAYGKQAVINITNSSAAGASDKIFQLNGATKLNIDGFKADNFGTFVRTNGGFQGNWSINLKNIEANNGKFSFVKSDCNDLNVSLDNIKLSNVAHHLKVPTSAKIDGNII